MNSISLRINELIDKLFDGNNSKFAQKLGINEANVRNYRKGTLPKIDFIIKIYENIEFNFDWLLTGKGEILPNPEGKKEKSNEDLNLLKERLNGYKDLNGIYLKKIDYLQNKLDECQSEKKRV